MNPSSHHCQLLGEGWPTLSLCSHNSHSHHRLEVCQRWLCSAHMVTLVHTSPETQYLAVASLGLPACEDENTFLWSGVHLVQNPICLKTLRAQHTPSPHSCNNQWQRKNSSSGFSFLMHHSYYNYIASCAHLSTWGMSSMTATVKIWRAIFSHMPLPRN